MAINILVVDDEEAIADLVEVYLKSENYNVLKCYNGKDALKCVEKEGIDLAILDVMLPDIDGFDICQKIRENHHFPVIMLTARDENIDKITGLTIGQMIISQSHSRCWSLLQESKHSFAE